MLPSAALRPCRTFPGKPNADGYRRVTRKGVTRYAHVVACEEAHGPRPSPRHQAAHNCGNAACDEPEHLRWATQSENEADKLLHGTDNNGERNGQCKLNAAQVAEIRAMPKGSRAFARQLGISWSQLKRIRKGARRALA